MIFLKLQGGLGNQMFEYAFARALSIRTNDKICLDMSGLTNLTHNVYSLDHFNITNVETINNYHVEKNKKLGYKISNHFIWRAYNKGGLRKKFKIEKKMQIVFNTFGIYSCTDGYVKTYKSLSKDKYVEGFFQSSKYFSKYIDIIKNELLVKDKILPQNKDILKEIKKSESICIHIRRGDYTVVTNHLVCTIEYYKKAVELMKSEIKNPRFFVFSDDINWVKENIDFNCNVTYVEGNNPNYEELRLMYSCKHFIISNSSFSWWAQYLSKNKNKIVVAPSRWFNDKNQICDIYEENWIKIEV